MMSEKKEYELRRLHHFHAKISGEWLRQLSNSWLGQQDVENTTRSGVNLDHETKRIEGKLLCFDYICEMGGFCTKTGALNAQTSQQSCKKFINENIDIKKKVI